MIDLTFAVPDGDLEQPTGGGYTPLATGAYTATLGRTFEPAAEMVGSERTSEDGTPAWQALKIWFSEFDNGTTVAEHEVPQTITLKSDPPEGSSQQKIDGCKTAERIGRETLLKTARAFDLTQSDGENTTLLITDIDELVEAINSLAGGKYNVYVKTEKRMRNGEVQLKDNGEPWMDSKVSNVRKPD